MRRSHDENGSIQMNMDSLGVVYLDLSISPDVFGLRAFDATKPVTRMLPGSSPCELRLTLPDDALGRESSDNSDETDMPEAGVSRPPSLDSSSEVIPTVGYAHMPLPSVDNSVMPELVRCGCLLFLNQQYGQWIEKLQYLGGGWPGRVRSSRKGRRSLSVHWGLGVPSGTPHTVFLNHPRFVEWIGVPQSAGLLELSGRQWVDKLSRDQAVTAAVHLQRYVGLMQTNVHVLDQYALSLQKAATRIIDRCLGPYGYPAVDIARGALGPRVRRAAIQMESMGLWRPSLDPLRLH